VGVCVTAHGYTTCTDTRATVMAGIIRHHASSDLRPVQLRSYGRCRVESIRWLLRGTIPYGMGDRRRRHDTIVCTWMWRCNQLVPIVACVGAVVTTHVRHVLDTRVRARLYVRDATVVRTRLTFGMRMYARTHGAHSCVNAVLHVHHSYSHVIRSGTHRECHVRSARHGVGKARVRTTSPSAHHMMAHHFVRVLNVHVIHCCRSYNNRVADHVHVCATHRAALARHYSSVLVACPVALCTHTRHSTIIHY
jgi:hypothetical protein